MSKIRTEERPTPEHTHATEFEKKLEPNVKAGKVHANTLRHSYETALNVRPDDGHAGEAARGAEAGKPAQPDK